MDVYVQTANGVSVIHATDLHPFWDQTTGAWTLAENLHSGDQLRTDDGRVATVAKTVQLEGARNMWDLTVANDHDFYVSVAAGSQTAVLVHNCPSSVPEEWGEGQPNQKGIGQRWTDPSDPGNGVRIDQGNPDSSFPSRQVDHVVVRSGGRILGPDGLPIDGPLSDNPQAHIAYGDWLEWSLWNSP